MKYILLMMEKPEDFVGRDKARTDWPHSAAWMIYHDMLAKAGIVVSGAPLHAPSTATTVRLKDGKRQVQDGPYADTKEQLGGFYIIDVPSLDAALEWAAKAPAADYGAVEVRPVIDTEK